MATLTIAGVTAKVEVDGGFVRTADPRAPEIVNAADGGILSGVVTARTHRNVYEIRTPRLLATDAAAVLAVLTSGVALTVSGTLLSAGISGYAGNVEQEWTDGGMYRVLSFELHQSAT